MKTGKHNRSSSPTGETRAQTTANLAGTKDDTTWYREEGIRHCELEGGPPHVG